MLLIKINSMTYIVKNEGGNIMKLNELFKSEEIINQVKEFLGENVEKFEELLEKSGFTINELQTEYAPRRIFNIMYMENKRKNLCVNSKKFTKKSLF